MMIMDFFNMYAPYIVMGLLIANVVLLAGFVWVLVNQRKLKKRSKSINYQEQIDNLASQIKTLKSIPKTNDTTIRFTRRLNQLEADIKRLDAAIVTLNGGFVVPSQAMMD